MRLALLDHPASELITAEDSARGDVEVAGPLALSVARPCDRFPAGA